MTRELNDDDVALMLTGQSTPKDARTLPDDLRKPHPVTDGLEDEE